MPASDTSIVVTTYRRHAFIRALFYWYSSLDFTGELIIADASSSSDELTRSLSGEAWPFEWTVLSVPKSDSISTANSMNEALSVGLRSARRPFAILSCDDDWLEVMALELGQQLLMTKPEALSVNGDRYFYSIQDRRFQPASARFGVLRSFPYCQNSRDISGSTSFVRLSRYLQGGMFHTMFTLAPTKVWRSVVPEAPVDQDFPSFAADFRWMLGIVARGPSISVGLPLTFSLKHNSNLSSHGSYARWGSPVGTWAKEEAKFVEFLVDLIGSNSDGNDQEHLAQDLMNQLRGIRTMPTEGSLRRFTRLVQGLVRHMPFTRRFTQLRKDRTLLDLHVQQLREGD